MKSSEKSGRDSMNVTSNKLSEEPIRLNLGSGYRYIEGWTNIDNRECTKPDVVLDVLNGLLYEDNTVSEIRAFDFLEHIPLGRTVEVIEEIYRVLKPGGKFESFTPSTDSRAAFQDPTHVSFWNKNSWFYFCEIEHRMLYGIKANFSGTIEDQISDSANHIIHTHCVLYAVKEEKK